MSQSLARRERRSSQSFDKREVPKVAKRLGISIAEASLLVQLWDIKERRESRAS